jgi:DNA excision repair protein ERCC-3
LIVQSDKTLLLEVEHPQYHEARAAIAPFAELERSPEHVHTYRLTPLGLWNARAAGHDAEQVVDALVRFSRYTVPHALLVDVADTMDRYGRLQLMKHPTHGLVLVSLDRAVLEEVLRQKKITPMLGDRVDPDMVPVTSTVRRTRSNWTTPIGRCVTTSRMRSTRFGPVAPAWWFCLVAQARPWLVRPRWHRPRPPRSSS